MTLNEVLLNLRADGFEQVPQVTDHREVSQDGVIALQHIVETQQYQRADDDEGPEDLWMEVSTTCKQPRRQCGDDQEVVSH